MPEGSLTTIPLKKETRALLRERGFTKRGESWDASLNRMMSDLALLDALRLPQRGGLEIETPLKNAEAWREMDKILKETGESPLQLTGEPRIGKSLLVQELIKNDVSRDYFIVVGRHSLKGYDKLLKSKVLKQMKDLSKFKPDFKGKQVFILEGNKAQDKAETDRIYLSVKQNSKGWDSRRWEGKLSSKGKYLNEFVLVLEEAHDYLREAQRIFKSDAKHFKIIVVSPDPVVQNGKVVKVVSRG